MANQMDSFGGRVKARIYELGVTQREIAVRMGIAENTLVNYIKGRRLPDVSILRNMAQALECTADWLIFGEMKRHKGLPILPQKFIEEARYQARKSARVAEERKGYIRPERLQQLEAENERLRKALLDALSGTGNTSPPDIDALADIARSLRELLEKLEGVIFKDFEGQK